MKYLKLLDIRKGRANRRQFILCLFLNFIICFALFYVFLSPYVFIIFFYFLCLIVWRRARDFNDEMGGRLEMVSYASYWVNYLLLLFITSGTLGPNQYGRPPVGWNLFTMVSDYTAEDFTNDIKKTYKKW